MMYIGTPAATIPAMISVGSVDAPYRMGSNPSLNDLDHLIQIAAPYGGNSNLPLQAADIHRETE